MFWWTRFYGNTGFGQKIPKTKNQKQDNDNRIIVAHVHHWLRDSADRDEKIVRDYCKQHELEFEILHADIKKEAKKTKTTIEECARNIRKAWLEEIRVKHSANYILTAHHADDQTETILYRLIKGTSITGLSWIQELSGTYFRPLLWVKKKDILAYAKKNNIPFGHDETNDDTSIPRNLIRHQIVPRIEKINPEAGIALSRLSKNAQELKSSFDEFFAEFWNEITFDKYHRLPLAFQHELLRFWYEQANSSTHGFSTALVGELDRFLSTRNGGKKELWNIWIEKKYSTIYLTNIIL